ncbi:MAG: CDP-diacylglycerol--serine O-phosphatidyltransferase [Gammaproteobacteria bacterium]|nr:MAG: CDP-diacylglycerol--serine O-phosphatidyltransferase [Gammaproteobacteria bacterium]
MKKDGTQRRRGIYLLPNLFTTSGMFCGFYAVISATNTTKDFSAAAIAIFIAMIMDSLDGRVARLTNTQSDFGVEYDSISDMLCFGVAPSLIMYQWSLSSLQGITWSKIGWLSAFIYTACAGLRLARFNTQVGVIDKKYFQGLASPAAAAVLMGFVWFWEKYKPFEKNEAVVFFSLFLTLATGLLMISNVRYYSFKDLDKNKKVSFITVVAIVLIVAGIYLYPPLVLFAGFFIYAASGPTLTILEIRRKRAKRIKEKHQNKKQAEHVIEDNPAEESESAADAGHEEAEQKNQAEQQ